VDVVEGKYEKTHTPKQKASIALSAIRGEKYPNWPATTKPIRTLSASGRNFWKKKHPPSFPTKGRKKTIPRKD
jgi:hypothetical protein